jgi:distribution and morphology protein 10
MVAGCELWRRKAKSAARDSDDGLEWARRKMRLHDFSASLPGSSVLADPAQPASPVKPETETEAETEASDSVVKIRVDQSWNVRILWEGRVKELLVSAGVGLGPGSFSMSPSAASGSGSSQSGGGAPGSSYWRGVGVSVLYSS